MSVVTNIFIAPSILYLYRVDLRKFVHKAAVQYKETQKRFKNASHNKKDTIFLMRKLQRLYLPQNIFIICEVVFL